MSIFQELPLGERRRKSRWQGVFAALFRHPDGHHRAALASELSAHGLRLEGDDLGLKVGDQIHVSFAALNQMQATVRWVRDGAAGVELEVALNPVVASILKSYSSASR